MRNIQIKLGMNSVYGVCILCNAAAFGRTAVINRRSTSSPACVELIVTVHVAPPARRPLPGAGVASWLTGFDAPAAALLSAAAARTPSTPRFHRRPSASERPIPVPHQLTPDGPSSSGRPATRVALALRA